MPPNLFLGIFNSVLGVIFVLIGLEIYWPFKSEKMKKMKAFYVLGGIGLLLWGN